MTMANDNRSTEQLLRAMTADLAEGEPHLDMDERPLGERIAAPPALDLAALLEATAGHTPGDWRATAEGVIYARPDKRSTRFESACPIAEVCDGYADRWMPEDERKANAALIAAAPALLRLAQAQAKRIAELEAALVELRAAP